MLTQDPPAVIIIPRCLTGTTGSRIVLLDPTAQSVIGIFDDGGSSLADPDQSILIVIIILISRRIANQIPRDIVVNIGVIDGGVFVSDRLLFSAVLAKILNDFKNVMPRGVIQRRFVSIITNDHIHVRPILHEQFYCVQTPKVNRSC